MPNDITQRLGFDAGNAIQQVNALATALDSLRVSMLGVANSARNFQNSTSGLDAGIRNLASTTKQGSIALSELSSSSNLAAAGSRQLVDQYGRVLSSSNSATTAVTKTGDALTKTGEDGKKAGDSITLSWQTMARILQTQLILRSINAIAQALHDATSAAIDFQVSVAEIQTIAGSGLGSFDNISESVRQLSRELGTPQEIISEGLYETISNQVVKVGEAVDFTREAEQLAIATHSKTADAVNALSSVLNSYREQNIETSRAADVLFRSVDLGRLKLSEVADILGRVLPITSQVGISFEEAAAAIATMTQSGVRADTAITQLRAVVVKLLKPTTALQEVFRKWGVETGEQAIAAFGGLQGVLNKLSDETEGNNAKFAEFLNNVRALAGAMDLARNDGQRFGEVLRDMTDQTNAAGAAFETIDKIDARKVIKSMNNLKVTMVEIGDTIVTVSSHIVGFFEPFVSSVPGLILGLTSIAIGLGVVAAAFIPATAWATAFAIACNLIPGVAIFTLATVAAGALSILALSLFDATEKTITFAEEYRKGMTAIETEGSASIEAIDKKWQDSNDARHKISLEFFAEMSKMYQGLVETAIRSNSAVEDSFKAASTSILADRLDIIEKIEAATLSSDDAVKKSSDRVVTIQQKLSDLTFQQDTRGLKGANLFYAELKRGIDDAAKALRDYGDAGADEEKALAASQKTGQAERKVRQALATAERLKDVRLIMVAEKALNKLLEDQATAEIKHQAARKKFQEETTKDFVTSQKGVNAELKLMGEEYVKLTSLFKDGVKKPQEEYNKDIEKAASLLKEMETKAAFTDADIDAFKSLGLEAAMKRLNVDLPAAFANVRLDVDRIEADLRTKIEGSEYFIKLKPAIDSLQPVLDTLQAKGIDIPDIDVTGDLGVQLRQSQDQLEELGHKGDTVFQDLTTSQTAATYAAKKFTEAITSEAITQPASQVGAFDLGSQTMKSVNQARMTLAEFANNLTTTQKAVADGSITSSASLETVVSNIEKAATAQYESGIIQKGSLEAVRNAIIAVRDQYKSLENVRRKQDELDRAGLSPESTKQIFDALETLKTQIQAANQEAGVTPQKFEESRVKVDEVTTQINGMTTAVGGTSTAVSGLNANLDQTLSKANAAAQALANVISRQQVISQSGVTVRENSGGRLGFFAAGGRGTDTIPAQLSPHEFVVNARSARRFFPQLLAMNAGQTPAYREQGGSVVNVGDINVNMTSTGSTQTDSRELARIIRRDLKRGTIRLN